MRIRELAPDELPFLREMLYAAAVWRPEDRERTPKDVALALPHLTIYHEGWGRSGDVALVAEEGGRPIGIVFYRFFTEKEHGHGYVDDDTPEIAIAVVDGHRTRGVGRALLEAIAERARRDGLKRLALSVNADNPAKYLYSSVGYRDFQPDDPFERMILELG